jgi:hypothetical protein
MRPPGATAVMEGLILLRQHPLLVEAFSLWQERLLDHLLSVFTTKKTKKERKEETS